MAETENSVQTEGREVLRIDIDALTEPELEELARIVVRKLRESMRQERDRTGRI